MKAREWSLHGIALLVVCCFASAGAWSDEISGPGVSVSPTNLSFGVPGTATHVASAPQSVTITVSGSGSATVTSITQSGSSDFSETDTCGTNPPGSNTIAAPGCAVNVTFTPSSTGLKTAMLSIATVPGGTTQVSLTGALGAIPLFNNPVDVSASNGNGLVTFNSQPYNLNCQPGPAKISSSPDGLGNVVVDNYITLSVGPTSTSQAPFGPGSPPGNVCTGGVAEGSQQDCFTTSYEGAAGNQGANGDDPDSFASTWGVPPIDVSGAFSAGGPLTATFSLLDAGVVFTSTRLFLVSSCTVAGVVPGGTITGNPIDPNVASTQTQTSTFDGVGGQNASLTTDISKSPGSVPKGTTQVTTDFAIPQDLFSQLVAGTSVAPAVCLRLTAEKDSSKATMCKGFLIQCWDPGHTTLTGDNCVPSASAARNLFDATGFDSPDAPSGTNFLAGSGNASACFGVSNSCAQTSIGKTAPTTMLIGPGILLGGDQWLCPVGSMGASGCTNQQLDTSTPPSSASYDPANCVLTGTLAGDVCPLDTLTQFEGAADPKSGSTTNGKNSFFIPVVNVPLPFTQTAITGRNAAGWVNTPTVSVTFVSNQANYNPATGNPSANGFTAAPPYSVTYGLAPTSSPAPDTTFPVPGDATNYNLQTKPNLGAPLCTAGANGTPGTFTSVTNPTLNAPAMGFYNLHYFTTDCALTEELLFNPTAAQLTDATANWASFRTVAFGVDNGVPSLTCPAPSPNGNNGWYTSPASTNCTATDDFSGFGPGSPVTYGTCGTGPDCTVVQGPTTESFSVSPTGTGGASQIPQQQVTDLAGNLSDVQGPYATPVDQTAPTIAAKFSVSGTTFNVGQTVTAVYTCGDTGSGLANCGGRSVVAPSCPVAPGVGATSAVTGTIPIDTSVSAVGPHTVTAVDCAGNTSTPITYNVVYGSADLVIAALPNPLFGVKNGTYLTYKIIVLNLGPNTAANVVVKDTIPAGTTFYSAVSGTVTCTLAGCSDVVSGTPCTGSTSSNVVTCSTSTVKPVNSFSGFVIKLVVKVSVPKTPATISDTGSVSESGVDPHPGTNSFTVQTKVTQ
jgi:uncharacterized repeat protein (TIGR01451 family)